MNEFLQISFAIRQGEVGWNVYINNEIVELSSGYQALIRIFMEILYFSDTKSKGTIALPPCTHAPRYEHAHVL